MVKLDPEIAKVFTGADAVRAALASVIEMSKLTKCLAASANAK